MQGIDTRLSEIAFKNNWIEAMRRFVAKDRNGLVQLGGGAAWDPSAKSLFLPDATEPATPVGGVYVWSEGGELKAKDAAGLLGEMLRKTSSAADPTTTDLPTAGDASIHKNTASGNVFLAYNDGGAIKKVALT
jgi:hypothetical protein